MSIEQINQSRTMPGGEVLNEIAIVLLAGIIVGTYFSTRGITARVSGSEAGAMLR